MGVLSPSHHEIWATVSGASVDDLLKQQKALWNWGVTAIEVRADLIPSDVFSAFLGENDWKGPTFIAHFGIGADAQVAQKAITQSFRYDIYGGICHSRNPLVKDIQHASVEAGKSFAAAYHSQQPITLSEALQEFERQETFSPLFKKIAVRAHSFKEALTIVEATRLAAEKGGSPIVSAVFGKQRWARATLPGAGSVISFIVAHRVYNEEGNDDEQFTISEVDYLRAARIL